MEVEPDKKKTRRIGQREEVAKGKHLIRVFLGRDNVTHERHYHSEIFLGGAKQAEERISLRVMWAEIILPNI